MFSVFGSRTVLNFQVFEALLSLFDHSLPLHLLKGREPGIDIGLFIQFVRSVTGIIPTLIQPTDLRLVPCESSPTRFSLYCVTGLDKNGEELLETIHQVGLELHQDEFRSLSTAMLREIARRCFNDLRTIFLVHDKRMLGIVLEELNDLVSVQKVLSSREADILRRGITLTVNPGSRALSAVMKVSRVWPDIKDEFLLKPIRSGKGAGIIFGSDESRGQWIRRLEELRRRGLRGDESNFVIQRRIQQPRFKLWLHDGTKALQNYLVGTFMVVNGCYVGIGLWRTSPSRVCALSLGGAWMLSVLPSKN